MMTTRNTILTLMLALGLASCEEESSSTTASGGEESSGGESASGEGGTEDTTIRSDGDNPVTIEADDEGWHGDDGSAPPQAAGGEGESAPAESPWGATRAEQCRRPTRREMSASAQRDFDAGVRAAASGNVSQARQSFQAALASDSNAYKAAYNLGVLADRAGNTNQAMEFYRQALRIQGDYERAAEGMVAIYFRRNSVPDAIAFVQPLAQQHPTNLHLQALYAEVLVKGQRYDDAWTAARAALRCDERFVPALTALIKASIQQGRDELADSILEQALQIEDRNAELHFIKGSILRDQPGRFRDALNEFKRAVELRPDYSEARMALGISLLSGGNYQEALTHFNAAAQLSPTLVAVHLNLAEAYRSTKQWEKAKAAYNKALQMDANLALAHFNMGLMYQTAGAEFPGLDNLQALNKAKEEFTAYRNLMGPRLKRDDPSQQILEDLDRQIEREQRRIEREQRNAQREAERAARAAESGGEGGE